MVSGPSPSLLAILMDALGSSVLSDLEVTGRHRIDWTGEFGGFAPVVVRAGDVGQVSTVLRLCSEHRVPVVAQGGNTGLVGGSVPDRDRAVVVSTARLNRIDSFDPVAGAVTVGAGVTPVGLAEYLSGSGWRFAVDLGARDTATIGGMVATNAGGMRVFRHGTMRQQVLGLEYVLADGSVVSRLGGLRKDNTGYALDGLLCGSEGTLAVVTAARLALIADPARHSTALLGFDAMSDAVDAAWAIRRVCPEVEIVELVSASCARLVAAHHRLALPGWCGDESLAAVLLVEAASDDDPEASIAAAFDAVGVRDRVAVAVTEAQRSDLWRARDLITTTLPTLGPVAKFDVSIPHGSVVEVVAAVEAMVAADFGGVTWVFGHVCDDNLHLNVTGAHGPELQRKVLELVAGSGGTISAEHGIGRLKVSALPLVRGDREISLMADVKRAWDPTGIMNPGVIFPDDDPGFADRA